MNRSEAGRRFSICLEGLGCIEFDRKAFLRFIVADTLRFWRRLETGRRTNSSLVQADDLWFCVPSGWTLRVWRRE